MLTKYTPDLNAKDVTAATTVIGSAGTTITIRPSIETDGIWVAAQRASDEAYVPLFAHPSDVDALIIALIKARAAAARNASR